MLFRVVRPLVGQRIDTEEVDGASPFGPTIPFNCSFRRPLSVFPHLCGRVPLESGVSGSGAAALQRVEDLGDEVAAAIEGVH